MIVLVTGDRDWTNEIVIKDTIGRMSDSITTLVHGNAKGADRIAAKIALSLKIPVRSFPAQWDTHGLAAGPIRNRQMLKETHPEIVLAFHDDIENSKGTKDMINASLPYHSVRDIILTNSRGDWRYVTERIK